MFFLSQIEHKLRLPPSKLDAPLEEAIIEELQIIFLDKVIPKLGLCVSIYDVKSIDGGFVLPNEGAPTYKVVFRMIMFRPFVGEIITAKVKESDLKGVHLTLGFFDDIWVPKEGLPQPAAYQPDPQIPKIIRWVWQHPDADNLTIENEDEIRFQVITVDYPPVPLQQDDGSKPFAPMVVTGNINMEGLGPVRWWV